MRIITCSLFALALLTGCGTTPAPVSAPASGPASAPASGPASPGAPTTLASPSSPAPHRELPITDSGGAAAIPSGSWTAVVAVPAGHAPSGAVWRITPLPASPAGVTTVLTPGIHVDDAGAAPTGACLIAFHTTGKVDPDATIVKIADDGSGFTLVPTERRTIGAATILSAEVAGFSSYGVGTASKSARDAARKQRPKPAHHYAISVHDSVSFEVQGWRMRFRLDLNLAGGGDTFAGAYTGTATLAVTGRYTKPLGPVLGVGTIAWNGRGKAKADLYAELAPLVPLDAPGPYHLEDRTGYGTVTMKGSGALAMLAKAPAGTFRAPGIRVKDGVAVPFLVQVNGAKVIVEVANVGEFEGDLVRF